MKLTVDGIIHTRDGATLGFAAGFRLADFEAAMAGHVLGTATVTARYSLNPEVG